MTRISTYMIGKELDGGFTVIREIASSAGTGSVFSEGFIAHDQDGNEVFVKVLDLVKCEKAPDPLRDLQARVEVFNYERDLIAKCKGGRLRNVVVGINDGNIFDGDAPMGQVHYLIFEMAKGDVRSQADVSKKFDLAFSLRCLHQVSVGIWQLHKLGIAHQDVKPSNVLVFEAAKSKLGDLGHAHDRASPRPGVDHIVAGDPTYAPPEQFYGHAYTDWDQRRMACDLYLLGSLVVFFYTGISMTTHISKNMSPAHHWATNSGLSYETAVTYVRDAFDRSLAQIEPHLDEAIREDLALAIRQLCEPDPEHRGHPSNIRGRGARYSAERYISLFERLAKAAELGMIGKT